MQLPKFSSTLWRSGSTGRRNSRLLPIWVAQVRDQCCMFAKDGVKLERSTLTAGVGKATT